MAIRDTVTRGYVFGNTVATRGYSIGDAITLIPFVTFTLRPRSLSFTLPHRTLSTSLKSRLLNLKVR